MIKLLSKITPQSSNGIKKIINTVTTQQRQLRQGIKDGVAKGKRLSAQQKRNTIGSAHAQLVGIKRALSPELWYGFWGAISPLPGGTALGIGVGMLIKALKHKKIK